MHPPLEGDIGTILPFFLVGGVWFVDNPNQIHHGFSSELKNPFPRVYPLKICKNNIPATFHILGINFVLEP